MNKHTQGQRRHDKLTFAALQLRLSSYSTSPVVYGCYV